jgi:hypothetical protein
VLDDGGWHRPPMTRRALFLLYLTRWAAFGSRL